MDDYIEVMLSTPTSSSSSSVCPNCRVTFPSQSSNSRRQQQRTSCCPYCGTFYSRGRRHSHGRHQSSSRSSSHSHQALFPEIVNSDHRSGPLRAFGDFLAGRLGFPGNVTHVTGVLIRPTADIGLSLPPIMRDSNGKLVTLKCPSESRRGSHDSRFDDSLVDATDEWSSDFDSPPPLDYPIRDKTKEQFLEELEEAKETHNYDMIKEYYVMAFSSFQEINASFKENLQEEGGNMDNANIKTDLLDTVYIKLEEMSPLFAWQASYPVLAHLLRFICSLPMSDQQLLMSWFKSVHSDKMRSIVKNLLQFLTVSQFSRYGDKFMAHPPRKWWVPLAMKVLSMFNAINNSTRPNKIPYTEFYNTTLDHLDLMAEYYNWQNPDRPDRFSFCQYPFVLSIVAKRGILQKDSEHQMIINARKSLVATIIQNEPPNLDIFFFNISVRRSNLVSDSLNEIARKQRDLKKKLRVNFVGEPGLDMGGLTKEWFLLLIRQIFHPDYGMFVYHADKHCYWFSLTQTGNLREYNLIGVKLLSPPVVPQTQNVPVGTCNSCTLDDLAEVMPDIAQSLKNLLSYDGDVEDDFGITYQVSIEEYGQIKNHNLKSEGDALSVTKKNREEFVKLYTNWILNRGIYEPFKAFYLGFHSVCASNALIMLRPEEVEILVCGTPNLDLEELKKVTVYEGCTQNDEIIRDFWDVIENFSLENQKKLLLFTTGTDRIPVGGVAEMTFKITLAMGRTDMLPVSHTCFNQLVLPKYETKDILRDKLLVAINYAEGFGLE